jgi:hypothetical protein
MIERLLPPEISTVAMRGDDPEAVLFPEETALMDGAAEARRADLATAHGCARRARSNNAGKDCHLRRRRLTRRPAPRGAHG